ncbi:caspase family protein, partial [Acinetobacter baumannii]
AKRMADTLVGSFGFDQKTVTLLNSHEHGVQEPTRTNILASLNRLLGDPSLSRGDLFVFYFSGHGLATPKGDFLCPVDVDP